MEGPATNNDAVAAAIDACLPVEVRRCPQCGEVKPLAKFKKKNGRPWWCQKCSNRSYRHVLVRRHIRNLKEGFSELVKASTKPQIEAPHITEVCEKVVATFGGAEQFAMFFHEQLMQAAQAHPGSRNVMDGCRTVLRLIEASTEHRSSAPDVAKMSDDEIEAELTGMMDSISAMIEQSSDDQDDVPWDVDDEEEHLAIEAQDGQQPDTARE